MSLPRYAALASRQNATAPSSASRKLAGSLACLEKRAATRSAPFLVHCLGRSETTSARRREGRATTPMAAVSTAAVGRFIVVALLDVPDPPQRLARCDGKMHGL